MYVLFFQEILAVFQTLIHDLLTRIWFYYLILLFDFSENVRYLKLVSF